MGAPLFPQTETHAQAAKQSACHSRLNVQTTEKPAARPVAPLPPVHCLHSAGASTLPAPPLCPVPPLPARPPQIKRAFNCCADSAPLTMPAPVRSFAHCRRLSSMGRPAASKPAPLRCYRMQANSPNFPYRIYIGVFLIGLLLIYSFHADFRKKGCK